MNENNTFEFVVDEIAEGSRKAKKILGRGIILGVIIAFIVVCLAIKFFWGAILPLVFLGVFMYLWKYFNVELEYSMTSGMMTFSRIYGGNKRKKVLELLIKDMREIAPVTDDTMAHLNSLGVEQDYLFASSSKADDMYYAIFDKDGKLSVVYFEATQKTLQILRYYNSATVITQVAR